MPHPAAKCDFRRLNLRLTQSASGLMCLVAVNVVFVVGYAFAHRNDAASAARRVAASARTREGMRDDPTERCQMAAEHYTVRNGRAVLRPNRRADHIERCHQRSAGMIAANLNAQCPFLAAVFDTVSKGDASRPFDVVSHAIKITGVWEPRESAIIEDLPRDSLFVDVGANLGWHSLLALSLGHTVIAFEPMEANVELLKHSLCLNPGLEENLELHQVALTDMRDCTIGASHDNIGDGILVCGREQAAALAASLGAGSDDASAVRRESVVTGRLDYYLHVGQVCVRAHQRERVCS